MWESLGSSYQLQGDGSAKFIGGSQQRLYTLPRLTNSGDYVEFVVPPNVLTYTEFRATDTVTNAFIYLLAAGYFRNNTGTEDVYDGAFIFAPGDTIRFERGSGGTIKYYRNGVLRRTSTTTLTNPVQISFDWMYAATNDIIIKPSSNLELNITTTTLPDGYTVFAYSQQLIATGGSGSITWSKSSGTLPTGLIFSSSGLLSGTPSAASTFTFAAKATDSIGAEDIQSLTVVITTAPPLPYGFEQSGTELFCEANLMSQTNGSTVPSFTDKSIFARHLTAVSSQPTFQTGVINSKSVIRNSGSQNPLSNAANFPVRCGWVVAKYNGSAFSDYKGLLTDTVFQAILTSSNTGTKFFDLGYSYYEIRSNDRIYPVSSAPAPMNGFKVLFFRFWEPINVNGIQIFQDRTFTARKWNGDLALIVLCSRDFHEEDIHARSQAIANSYGLTLAYAYAYQPDVDGSSENVVQSVNFYDPPEGDRISETLTDSKRVIDLKFSGADQKEVKYMKSFYASHYTQALPFILRDYRFTPPEDIEGYWDSPYDLDGAYSDWAYSFKFREK